MTRSYLHTPALHVLSRGEMADIELSPREVIQLVETAYLSHAQGTSLCPTKLMMPHPKAERDAISFSMLGYDSTLDLVGFKTAYRQGSDRPEKYYPAITLYDDSTGMPLVFMDCHRVGGSRTPATSAIIAKHCAKKDARSALMLGTGGEVLNTLPYLLTAIPELETLRLFGTHPLGISATIANFEAHFPDRTIELVDDVPQAVSESDIVVAASGRAHHPKVQMGWMRPGGLLISVSSKGVDANALQEADYIVTTSAGQMAVTGRRLIGDREGQVVNAELPEIVSGKKSGRLNDDDRIFAFSSGMVIADIPVAHSLATKAIAAGRGRRIELWS